VAKCLRSFRLDDDVFEILRQMANERNQSHAETLEKLITSDREINDKMRSVEAEKAELNKELYAERKHNRLQIDRWDDERARLTANLDNERTENKKLHGVVTAINGDVNGLKLFGVGAKRLKRKLAALLEEI
jgi:septal ring factor EnvC (AmiA/AmiB activator)